MGKEYLYDLIVIGAGASGMAAAVAAAENGVERILLVDRNKDCGGILQQCIHDGFGLHLLGKSMTGPSYAQYWRDKMNQTKIELSYDTTVLEINYDKKPFELTMLSMQEGYQTYYAHSIILATGCFEKTTGHLKIPGSRPAGIYTAGTAQYMMNICNLKPGKTAVILGSGDIGLIMARRLTLEGLKVKLVLGEKASGLARNYMQCIYDYDIPLLFGYSVLSTHGYHRLKGVTIAPIDNQGTYIKDQKKYIACDTLLIAAGLVPEKTLWKSVETPYEKEPGIPVNSSGETIIPGVFACGNVTQIYDLVDKASKAGEITGTKAAHYLLHTTTMSQIPQNNDFCYSKEPGFEKLTQVNQNELLCTRCPKGCILSITYDDINEKYNVFGNKCNNGYTYALQEIEEPKRMITTTIKLEGSEKLLLPVESEFPIAKKLFADVMKECRKYVIKPPVQCGQTVIQNIAKSGVNLIACETVEQ